MNVAAIASLGSHLLQSARGRRSRRRLERRRHLEKRQNCQLEALEARWLMAADVGSLAAWQQARQADGPVLVGPVQPAGMMGAEMGPFQMLAAEAEGEGDVDLVAFAQALNDAGVKFFGADWCPFCTEQKELLGAGARYLEMIEVTNPDRTLNEIGQAEEISSFPTWEFPDGTRATGVLSLEDLSERSEVPIPTGVNPSFFPLQDITIAAGSPLHLPIEAYDPNGGPLTITAVSSNPGTVMAEVTEGNPSLRISVRNYGDMVFELFADKAPRPVERIIELVESGFYDAGTHDQPIIFHRVIEEFVLQAGDPTRTGAGGSDLGTFDDQFHVDLQHNQAGVLSFAKAGDDTNDSQFFITAGPQRALDFNHSVFGQLIVGESVRAGIDRVPTNEQDRPLSDVEIVSMSIEMDEVNGLVMLKTPHGMTGEADVTITVTDTDGNSHSQTIRVAAVADTFNSAPFLDDIPPLSTTANVPLNFQLTATDVEGDPMCFDAILGGDIEFDFEIDHDTGEVVVQPPQDFIGTLELLVGVRGVTPTDSVDQFDTQLLSIDVLPNAPSDLVLLPEFDTGVSDSDRITNLRQLGIQVDGVTAGAFVSVLVDNVVVGQGTATDSSIVINADLTSFSDGTHSITAMQQLEGMTSERSEALEVTVDTAAPIFESTPPVEAMVGETLTYVAQTNEEGTAVTYSLVGAPAGVSIDPETGVMTWTPSAGQRGGFDFTLVATDLAGNSAEQTIEIDVLGEEMVRFRLVTTDLEGNPDDSFAIGQEFYLQVFVADVREDARGVFAAYLDVLFTQQLVTTAGELEFGDQFPGDRVGDLSDPTKIDDAGAIMELEETGDSEFLLFQVRLRALEGGEEVIQSQYADNSPLRDTMVFGRTEAVPENQIGFGSVTVQIATPFTAVNDLFNIDEDTSETFDVLANDLFPGGDISQLRIVELGTPDQGGEVSITEDGRVFYQPAPDFFGVETFTYTITDDENGTSTATVTVQVHPVNDPPTAVDDFFTGDDAVLRNSTNNVLDLLANDTFEPDVDEVLRIISVGETSHGGQVTIGANGAHVFYTPATDFVGVETFEYTISDGNDGTDTALVTVEVVASPTDPTFDPPVANDDTGSERFIVRHDGGPQNLDVLRNDTMDPDFDGELIIQSVSSGSHGGTITVASDGKSIRYTPATGFLGTETFTYTITDGSGRTDSATVEVEVREILPGKIGGVVYVDQNGNGTQEGNEHLVAGVEVTLSGTDDLGQTVERTTRTDGKGEYVFSDLPPGTYQVTGSRPVFFASGSTATGVVDSSAGNPTREITLQEGATVMDSDFAERGPALPYLSIRDLFASNHAESVVVIAGGSAGSVITAGSPAWQAVQITSAQLNGSQSHWELTAEDSEGGEWLAVVPNQDGRALRVMGTQGSQTMLRLYGTPEMIGFQPAGSSESHAASNSQNNSQDNSGSGAGQGGGEAEGESSSSTALMDALAQSLTVPPAEAASQEFSGSESPANSAATMPPADEPFANWDNPVHGELVEDELIESLADTTPVQPEVVESALFSMMLASSRR